MSTTTSKVRPGSNETSTASARYEDDLYGWVEAQVALLKAGRLAEVDAENIAEELADVGHDQYDKLESALSILMMHLLKWDHQPTHRSRSWLNTVHEQRKRIARVLRKNPSLKSRIPEATEEGYEDARDNAAAETGIAKKLFPKVCPYDWSVITTRVIEFDDLRSPEE
ncbi:DUF29 domain-containing protein [Bradyrhizobium roseum]|uniref:DUF29 domain-containing protein n=1 Tax=Bradyrhizobium roseum TaxID=3056648 RepID=UPI0026037C04|nr:DUF29 domain-containing protein [Bradyrhizobium roseus]WKA29229.1 DUF29 domain-containing protein [Bradyrhizobium roseus]